MFIDTGTNVSSAFFARAKRIPAGLRRRLVDVVHDRLADVRDARGRSSRGRGGTEAAEYRVLLVCRGNICRSPLAEGLLRRRLEQSGLQGRVEVTSAGTDGWARGRKPHWRARACARRRGFAIGDVRAKCVDDLDVSLFDLVLAVDERTRLALVERGVTDVSLLRSSLDGRDVPDPIIGGDAEFETSYRLLEEACDTLLAQLESRVKPRGR